MRAFTAQLEGETAQRAVRAAAETFGQIAAGSAVTAKVAGGVKQLDEFIQPRLHTLWTGLFTDGRGQTVSTPLWDTLVQYYRSAYSAYWHCLTRREEGENFTAQSHAEAMVVAARALTALTRYLLLLRLRYQDAPQVLWSQLNGLVAWVVQHGNVTAEMEQYPGTPSKTTVERELLVMLLLAVAPTGNLLPAQMHALDVLLRTYLGYFRIANSYDDEARPFGFEPSRNEPPCRWLKAVPVRPGVRFFGPGRAYLEVREVLEQARDSGNFPAWLAAQRCTPDDCRDLMEKLVATWSPQPPQRRQRRDAHEGELLVAHEWSDIQQLLKFAELAKSGRSLAYDTDRAYGINSTMRARSDAPLRDPKAAAPTSTDEVMNNLLSYESSLDHDAVEIWALTDTSESGIGATSAGDCPWLGISRLIAYRLPESTAWGLAVVRRLNKLANNRFGVGMTKLSGSISAARLRLGIGTIDYSRAIGRNDAAIEYDAVMLQDGAPSLLLPVGVVDTTWKYTLTANNRHTIVKMEKSVQRGLNFEQVEISVFEAARAA